ncbi:dihydrolipoyllysine-residue acetyltransferase component of pyruvate dehydrogenase complex [bacterium BMS3Bbin11]|nr:dihydrolipoyllysine-residue acetyltransferase component of pyruvate dehydrogenase complex [bacterium BMS3Abin11]GBE45202.1 dihydrolipoyllysine-residue acetyltransferase component of pyruvate dehydrogenase complex [bacterium BMS3Bbin11]HDH14975.1 dihydrolipoyllysine-residue acetyltransferase [Gammaproteobacteria bacterium]
MANIIEIPVPDIGDFDEVEVIEVLVSAGDNVEVEDSLISLESDKATMEIPSPAAGVVKEVKVAIGDKVSRGSPILLLESSEAVASSTDDTIEDTKTDDQKSDTTEISADTPAAETSSVSATQTNDVVPYAPDTIAGLVRSHASPSVRHFAFDLGVNLNQVRGSGPKARILKEDVQNFVKQAMQQGAGAPSPTGSAIPPIPKVDFAKFGDIETRPLSRIRKIAGKHLHACWLNIPHVTQFDEADTTDLEEFRQSMKREAAHKGVRLTPLVFIMKAVISALKEYPQFNASLDETNENLIIKNYYNIGVAVDTPEGLIVPVIRDVDSKGYYELAEELMDISSRAREGSLMPADLQGGTFSISSLGGIGGTNFTPIVNAPEVAILGVARSQMKPIWNGKDFEPRLMLPLAISYNHRVIDGADGARFITYLSKMLTDIRKVLL